MPSQWQEWLHKPKEIQIYERLVYMMKNVQVNLDKLDMAYNPTSQVKNVWVRKDETIHVTTHFFFFLYTNHLLKH
jgi:hypothetical protein